MSLPDNDFPRSPPDTFPWQDGRAAEHFTPEWLGNKPATPRPAGLTDHMKMSPEKIDFLLCFENAALTDPASDLSPGPRSGQPADGGTSAFRKTSRKTRFQAHFPGISVNFPGSMRGNAGFGLVQTTGAPQKRPPNSPIQRGPNSLRAMTEVRS